MSNLPTEIVLKQDQVVAVSQRHYVLNPIEHDVACETPQVISGLDLDVRTSREPTVAEFSASDPPQRLGASFDAVHWNTVASAYTHALQASPYNVLEIKHNLPDPLPSVAFKRTVSNERL
jgi:hypothetical protein